MCSITVRTADGPSLWSDTVIPDLARPTFEVGTFDLTKQDELGQYSGKHLANVHTI